MQPKDVLIALGVWDRLPAPVRTSIEERKNPSWAEVQGAIPPGSGTEAGADDAAEAMQALRVVLEGGRGHRRTPADVMPGLVRGLLGNPALLGRARRLDQLSNLHRVWSSFLDPQAVLRFIADPSIISIIDEREESERLDEIFLVDIALAPHTRRLFEAFIARMGALVHRAPLERYLDAFGAIALGELIHGVDPFAVSIDWRPLGSRLRPEEEAEAAALTERIVGELSQGRGPAGRAASVRDDIARLLATDPSALASVKRTGGAHPLIPFALSLIGVLQQGEAGGVSASERQEIFVHLVKAMAALPQGRPGEWGPMRTWFVAAALAGGAAPKMMAVDLLPLLEADIAERRATINPDRGGAEADVVLLLARLHHPQGPAVAERILGDLLAPLLRRGTDRPEELAMRALREFMDGAEGALAALPLTPQGTELLRRARTRQTAAASARLPDESVQQLGRVDEVFYGLRPPEEGHPELEAGESPASSAAAELPPLAATGEASSLELVMREGGGALARGTIAVDPRTGLAVVHMGGGLAIPVWRAIAPYSAAAGQVGRQDWQGRVTADLGTTMAELNRLEDERQGASASALVPRPADQALAESRLARLRDADSVQMMLGGRAGTDVRERLIDALRGAISIERGLAMLELALQRTRGDASIRVESVEDAARPLPNITAVEVAVLSLLDRVPPLVLEQDGLTMIYGFTPGGVEWASDAYDPTTERQGLHPVDPYVYLGVTEMHAGTNFSFFREEIRRLLFGILRSGLTDRFFFDHLWTAHPDAATVGLNRLREEANPRVPLGKEVIDLGTRRTFAAAEIARLIGLLERVPASLARAGAARIYFKPFAAGVLFADHDGRPIEYVPYHPHLRNETFQEVHYQVEQDATDANPLMRQLLGGDVFAAFLQAAFDGTGGELSPLEREAMDVEARYRIALPLATRLASRPTGFEWDLPPADVSIKMGRDEIAAVDGVLSRLPPHLLALARDGREGLGGIRVIHKAVAPSPNMMTMRVSDGRLGLYDAIERSVTLYHFQEQPYRLLSPEEQQIWRDTIAHEIGEAVFETLTAAEVADFLSIYPWRPRYGLSGQRLAVTAENALDLSAWGDITPDMADEEIRAHFLTSYSTSQPRDLFAEAFAAYLHHGPEFRRRAEGSPYLRQLYDWMATRAFIDGVGSTIHYADEAAASLADIEMAVRRWRADVAERQRDLEHELADRAERAKADGAIAGVAWSVEEESEREFAQDEAAHREEMGEGYAGVYYDVVAEDEASRRARRFEELREAGVPGEIVAAIEAMTEVIAGEVDVDEPMVVMGAEDDEEVYDSAEDDDVDEDAYGDVDDDGDYLIREYEIPPGDLAEQMAAAAWDAMSGRGNQRDNVQAALQRHASRNGQRHGVEVTTFIDSDIVDELVVRAAGALAGGDPALAEISLALSDYILPGQYEAQDLSRLHGLLYDKGFSDFQSMGRVFRFFVEDERFDLSREEIAEVVAALFSRMRRGYQYFQGESLVRVIVALGDERATIRGVAQMVGQGAGAVDAFAEAFLQPAEYAALRQRSRGEGGGSGGEGGGPPPTSPGGVTPPPAAPSGPASSGSDPSGTSGADASPGLGAFRGIVFVSGSEEGGWGGGGIVGDELSDERAGTLPLMPAEFGVSPADVAMCSGAILVSPASVAPAAF